MKNYLALFFLQILASMTLLQKCLLTCLSRARHINRPIPSYLSPCLNKAYRSSFSIQMNAAPKGSVWEETNRKLLKDPSSSFPWDIQIPFFKEIKRDGPDNWWHQFIIGEWSYLDHRPDARKPAGKIHGGQELYEGMGIELLGGKDRQRFEKFSKVMDHGVAWRQNMDGPVMKLHGLFPDGNQDVSFGESDTQLEERQWGSWGSHTSTEYILETGWREPLVEWDMVGMPYPWTHKRTDVQELPFAGRHPAAHVPHPPLDWELAAYNLLGELRDEPLNDYCRFYRQQIKALEVLEKELKDFDKNKKRRKSVKEFTFLPKKCTMLLKDADERFIRPILLRTRDLLRLLVKDPRKDPQWVIENILDHPELPDHRGGGEWNCTDQAIDEKTLAFNNAIISIKKYPNSYSEKLSKAEMAEMYHYSMTEMRREGRYRDYAEEIAQENDVVYEKRDDRKLFPGLMSIYKPLWTNRQYGDEFGDALKKEDHVDEESVFQFGHPLKFHASNSTNTTEELNYINEYTH